MELEVLLSSILNILFLLCGSRHVYHILYMLCNAGTHQQVLLQSVFLGEKFWSVIIYILYRVLIM